MLYLVWLAALWFHLTHGMWSAFHTIGASGKTWLPRVKCISYIYSTVLMAMYAAVVIKFCVQPCSKATCTLAAKLRNFYLLHSLYI